MKNLFLTTLLLLSFSFLSAENRIITGIVGTTELSPTIPGGKHLEQFMAIPGVMVKVKGSPLGATTNIEGKFALTVADKEVTLIFSHYGFLEKEFKVGTENNINITLESDQEVKDKTEPSYKVGGKLRTDLPKEALTAAAWSDLDNWDLWMELLIDYNWDYMENSLGFNLENRITTFIVTPGQLPVNNVEVKLYSKKDEVLWSGISDMEGKVELWPDIYDLAPSDKFTVTVKAEGSDLKTFKAIRSGGIYYLEYNVPVITPQNLDIQSIGITNNTEEFRNIDKTISEIAQHLSLNNRNIEANMHTTYFTKSAQGQYINQNEKARGMAEDLATTSFEDLLSKKINSADWSEKACSKVLFLSLEEMPHRNNLNLPYLQKSIREASEKGIKIVPVVTKSIDKESEFLLRFMSMATGGTYIFLTDHLGNTNYIKPTIGKYEDNKLEVVLKKLLEKYVSPVGQL
ncbi:carboxypeptidase-like regulatory domain-containing protein [Flexithrix dorotheae]|uniref:carboxypeptidase-like regulatory domain-containing protein n=1 Tax=Flexithrix dorotheae TaxID=70993 RepID=UPI00037B0365|nr:carboxypeptidase-like regulatory domain-containing protein [Flexithrix dorotheae]